ncbi:MULTISPECIES: ABC transporter ATP-binding protein [Clostridium]|uniref:ABC transporter ATP-binding protein n=1 Tax=Clostridium TaxID=1485 RepID=UPI000C079A86|nr:MULTISPECIES: ABC transporter ATP-binding protein [Clostridium]MDU2107083.1 ABC transporter ATP-binding protein [Clostridium sp.]MDU3353726.1 ABC transporter ATP-binding protein [Clostridium sp.]MDU4725403.1 ABC transporter ATP-binding protein [Clostridium sp.]
MSLIELKEISKTYGKGEASVEALKSLELKVDEGEFVAIVGPSGSGKSTLLNIIGSLDRATAGEYLFNGVNISNFSQKDMATFRGEEIGFVFQNFNLLNDKTVVDNVMVPLRFSKKFKGNKRDRAMELIERVGIKGQDSKRVNELSGGQQQRVAIARALVNSPRIILADEPTGALDKKTGESIMELLRELNKGGTTVIIITHDEKIASSSDRIIRIEDGMIKY